MSPERLLTCEEVIDFLSDYVEGELDEGVRARFDAHLAVCPACVDYLDSYRATMHYASATRDGESPDEVPEALVRAVLAARRR